jgi:transposase
MVKRIHGIDRHKRSSTISVLNREGLEIELISSCLDLNQYIKGLTEEDAVAFETGQGSFYWADKIEATGALCFIINPYRFRIIKDSWNKTDKNDSRNMAKALWAHVITGEFDLPTVYKPAKSIRDLRQLFTVYDNLNRHLVMLKNSIQSIITENGKVLTTEEKKILFHEDKGLLLLEKMDISKAGKISIITSLKILWIVSAEKSQLAEEITYAGRIFSKEVKLLMSIRGISPLTALAFLSDVGDIRRFQTTRRMNAYLGLVPKMRASGTTSRVGHINRASRQTTRTILTQSLIHVTKASPYLYSYYESIKKRRGAGRARIALIRKLCFIMRRMLLSGEIFNSVDNDLYFKKIRKFDRTIENMRKQKICA